MNKQIFINLPVRDLPRAKAFYAAIGAVNNPQFTDETAACMVVSEEIFVMLLTEPKFKSFAPKPIADATKSTEVMIALSYDSKDEVNKIVATATANGGSTYAEPKDYGFMYQHGFQDLDGHMWELAYMDMSAFPQA